MTEPGAIHIADDDPSWPGQAAAAIEALRAAVPGLFVEIEHIGSTAVPGLAAKPVIDLMAAVHDLTHAARHQGALADLGFRPHDNRMTDRLLYVREADGVRYAQLKRTIVAAGTGPGEYARAKTALVRELTDRARSQLGLPPVPVWEKP